MKKREKGLARLEQIGTVAVGQKTVLPMRLRQGIREALDGGRGRLRMDPQDLADLIASAIDMERRRIKRIAAEREAQRRLKGMFREAERYLTPNGQNGNAANKGRAKFTHPVDYLAGDGGGRDER